MLARVESPPSTPDGVRQLRWSNAGHLPPLLRTADGSVVRLEARPNLLLGLDQGTERVDQVVDLPPGSTLLLYTDGLVERRDEMLEDSIDTLADAFATWAARRRRRSATPCSTPSGPRPATTTSPCSSCAATTEPHRSRSRRRRFRGNVRCR